MAAVWAARAARAAKAMLFLSPDLEFRVQHGPEVPLKLGGELASLRREPVGSCSLSGKSPPGAAGIYPLFTLPSPELPS